MLVIDLRSLRIQVTVFLSKRATMDMESYSPENTVIHVVLLQNVISPLVSFRDTIWLSDEGRLFKAAAHWH